MKRYIILSVNNNPEYTYYVELAFWAWLKIGWEPVLIERGSNIYRGPFVNNIDGYRDDTITQVSRLYGSYFVEDGAMIMTGDIDLIPLSDYWHPKENEITCYGHDLAEYKHYPICYIAMTKEKWKQVMRLEGMNIGLMIKRDLDSLPQAKDPDFWKYWFTDQDLITDRLKGFQINSILRGKLPNGLAKGRVDRGGWTLDHEQFIDAHLHRDLYKVFQNPNDERYSLFQKKWKEHMELLHKVWPNEDWTWFIEYTKQFAKLAQ